MSINKLKNNPVFLVSLDSEKAVATGRVLTRPQSSLSLLGYLESPTLACTQPLFYFSFRSFRKHRRARASVEREKAMAVNNSPAVFIFITRTRRTLKRK